MTQLRFDTPRIYYYAIAKQAEISSIPIFEGDYCCGGMLQGAKVGLNTENSRAISKRQR